MIQSLRYDSVRFLFSSIVLLLLFFLYSRLAVVTFNSAVALEQCITLESDVMLIKSINWMFAWQRDVCDKYMYCIYLMYVFFFVIYFQMSYNFTSVSHFNSNYFIFLIFHSCWTSLRERRQITHSMSISFQSCVYLSREFLFNFYLETGIEIETESETSYYALTCRAKHYTLLMTVKKKKNDSSW